MKTTPEAVFWNKKYRESEKLIERLILTLHNELPKKYPDDCEKCHGRNGGVKGNENIVT
jgi:hypothetical protein